MRRPLVPAARLLASAVALLTSASIIGASPATAAPSSLSGNFSTSSASAKPRTVVTTDMESDDIASLVRYFLYTNELDTKGIVYSSSKFHWAGDGKGTEFFLPDREYTTPQTSWRWTGNTTIEDQLIPDIIA